MKINILEIDALTKSIMFFNKLDHEIDIIIENRFTYILKTIPSLWEAWSLLKEIYCYTLIIIISAVIIINNNIECYIIIYDYPICLY